MRHDSKSQGQEEADHTRQMSEFIYVRTDSTTLKFVNTLYKLPLNLYCLTQYVLTTQNQ